jgi:hypothetical protein
MSRSGKAECVKALKGLALQQAWNAGDTSRQGDLAGARQRQSFSRTLLSQKPKQYTRHTCN